MQNESDNYRQIASDVSIEFVEEACRLYGIRACAEGGRTSYDIEGLKVSFHSESVSDINQARKLQIQLAGLFLEKINSKKQLRPYLREYPFPASRLSIAVHYKKEPENFALAHLTRDKIFYSQDHIDEPLGRQIHEETYEEAERIVAEQEANAGKTSLEVL